MKIKRSFSKITLDFGKAKRRKIIKELTNFSQTKTSIVSTHKKKLFRLRSQKSNDHIH